MANSKSDIQNGSSIYAVTIVKIDKSTGHETEIIDIVIPLTYCRLLYNMLRNHLKLSNMEKD